MAIVANDILFKLSVAAAAGNTTAQADPNASLGDQISTTAIVDATLSNLFDKITGDDNAASDVEYRCFFVHNNHGALTWEAVKVWIFSEVADGAAVAIGLDPAGVTAKGLAAPQAAVIATEQDVPAGVVFTSPVTKATGLTIGDIPAGSVAAVWVRRTAANTPAVDLDGAVVRFEGDTAA